VQLLFADVAVHSRNGFGTSRSDDRGRLGSLRILPWMLTTHRIGYYKNTDLCLNAIGDNPCVGSGAHEDTKGTLPMAHRLVRAASRAPLCPRNQSAPSCSLS